MVLRAAVEPGMQKWARERAGLDIEQLYRTMGGVHPGRSSPNLLDTLYDCQARQDWYRNHGPLEGDGL